MIPLVLLAGFLGAGKTRLLSELIPALHAKGTRVRVILNDFENANIDAARLGELEALVTPLNGECVCCGSLRELLDTLYAVPADPDTVLLIEANGATETDELLGHLTTDSRLAHFTLPMQVTVVDAGRWQKRWWHNGLERAQVATATHLFVNWTARVNTARMQAVTDSLAEINPRATRVEPHALADALHALVQDLKQPNRSGVSTSRGQHLAMMPVAESRAGSHHHVHAFGSATLPLPKQVERVRFTAFVAALPDAVVRAKGLVRFTDDPGSMYVWHRLPGRKGMRLDRSAPHADADPTALFIGVDMPMAQLDQAVQQLETSAGLTVSADSV
ncbi:MAG: GTP-binding protein [Gemmatimonadaceae bacterium]|nr:GTP-binding protein [Gemmatimonadaceae bacterium]